MAAAVMLRTHYACAIHDSMLWVTCIKCVPDMDIFQWRSERAFGIILLDEAIARHEKVWHQTSDSE